jgi:hypothetical protein
LVSGIHSALSMRDSTVPKLATRIQHPLQHAFNAVISSIIVQSLVDYNASTRYLTPPPSGLAMAVLGELVSMAEILRIL